MKSDLAKQVGDDWVGIIHDEVIYCRKCLPGWRVLGSVKKKPKN
jgi:hypothetical protein